MKTATDVRTDVEEIAEEVKEDVKPWLETFARLGYATKGIVYTLTGLFALQAAFGLRNPNVEFEDVFYNVLLQPMGRLFLFIILIGLLGYTMWRFLQAFNDADRVGNGLKGTVDRVASLISGIGYGALAYSALQMLNGDRSTDVGPEDWSEKVMAFPPGRWLIALVGLIVIGIGLYQFYRSYSANFTKRFRLGQISAEARKWVIRLGRLGFSARGVVYIVIGGFLFRAAYQYDSEEAGGLGEALANLAHQPYGPLVLGVVAAGLMAYGIYAIALSRLRRISIK